MRMRMLIFLEAEMKLIQKPRRYFSRTEIALWCSSVLLIILWGLATMEDISYPSVMICFIMFLMNDVYGYISWNRMKKRQIA